MTNFRSIFFETHSVRQTVFKNTVWLGTSQVISRLLKAVLIIYAARVIGVTGYGAFSYALGVVMIFYIASDFGLNSVVLKEAARHSTESARYLRDAFFLKLGSAFAAALLLLALSPYITRSPTSTAVLRILVIYFLLDSLKEYFLSLARAKEMMHFDAYASVAENAGTLAIGIPLLYFQPSAAMLAAAYGAGAGLALAVAFAGGGRHVRQFLTRPAVASLKETLIYSLPFALSAVIFTILNYTDTTMLGWLRDERTVGLYAAALKIPQVLMTFGGIMGLAVFPTLAKTADQDRPKFAKTVSHSIQLLYAFGFPIVMGGIILASKLIPAIYGPDFRESSGTFQILITTMFFILPMSILNIAALAKNLQRVTVRYSAYATILNIGLNYFLINAFGAVGAAIATLVSYTLAFILLLRLIQRSTGENLLAGEEMVKVIVASLVMAAGVLILEPYVGLWLGIIVGAVLYAALIYAFRPAIIHEVGDLVKFLR